MMRANVIAVVCALSGCASVFDLDPVASRTDAGPVVDGRPACIEEDFDSLSASAFHTWGDSEGVYPTVDGQLHIPVPAHTGATDVYGGVALGPRDFRGLGVQAELVQAPLDGPREAILELRVDNSNRYVLFVNGGRLWARKVIAGATTETDRGYDPAVQRFLSVWHDATSDEIVYEFSSDGTTWTTMNRTPRTLDLSAAGISIYAGSYDIADPWMAIWDNAVVTGDCAL